ncbi:starch-binding protein [bacterium]|nr:starch-binding protein [bacterium]
MRKLFYLFMIFSTIFWSCDDEKNSSTTVAEPIFSPQSGEYDEGVSITISQEKNYDILYTTNGDDPKTLGIKYVAPLTLQAGTYTVKAIAKDGLNYSKEVSSSYVIKERVEENNLVINFYKPDSWGSSVNIYFWDTTPATDSILWPGLVMSNSSGNWYSYTIQNVVFANIIFNDGVNQTDDLTRAKNGWFKNGIWYDFNPDTPCDSVLCSNHGECVVEDNSPKCNCEEGYYADGLSCVQDIVNLCENITCGGFGECVVENSSPKCNCNEGYYADGLNCVQDVVNYCENINCSGYGVCVVENSAPKCNCNDGYHSSGLSCIPDWNGLAVHFKKPSDWSNSVNIHYWNTNPDVGETTWPGVLMESVGDGWYFYLIEGADSAKIVFNDGSGKQTTDLTRSSEGWYKDGAWYDQDPEQAEIPVITASPIAGVYPETQNVTLRGSNSDDIIYYTIDSTEPSTSSLVYQNQIVVDRTMEIRAFGVNRDSVRGAISRFSFTIDQNMDITPPQIVASLQPGVYPNPIDVTFTITDNKGGVTKSYYTLDNSTPNISSSQIYTQGDSLNGLTGASITISETKTVKFLVVDAAGNETTRNFTYRIGEQPLGDFREETIYFLLTARFYDGDPSNNYFNRDRIHFDENGVATDPHWRGDFKGLIQKLDYIAEMGFTAIWITPPVENRSGLDYHGYHAYDWYQIDKRLESPDATYQDFINEAHARGIKVIQDVVINHSSQYGIRGQVWIPHLPIKYYVPQGSTQGSIDNGPYQGNLGDYKSLYRDDNDNPVAPEWFRERHNSDAEGVVSLVDPKTDTTVPLAGYNPNRFFGIDLADLTSLSEWYHQSGFMAGGDWENPSAIQQKHLAGDCIDLATENQNVKDYLNGAIHQYLDMGIDAIRLDTVKHLERGNLLEYVNNWKAYRPGLFVFGENLVKGTGWGNLFGDDNGPSDLRPWWYTRTGNDLYSPSGDDSGFSVLDFGLFSTFRDNVSRGSYGGIGGVLTRDYVYGDATKLITFLQNHDVGPDNDFRDRFRGEQWMAAAAYNLLWTIRGIPCLYYGEEIEFQKGMPQDIVGNSDTLETTGRAYFGDYLEAGVINTTKSHPLFQHIKRLNEIRRATPALQKGVMGDVNEWGSGISFTRNYNNGESYVAVGLSVGDPNNITLNGETITIRNVKKGHYVDAVTGNSIDVKGDSITFFVKKNSAGIYILNGSGKIGKDGKYLK